MKLHEQTAATLSRMLRTKEISAEELTRAVADRMSEAEERVGAYLEQTTESALQTARRVDQKRAAGEALHPLAGIPVGIKDNICTEGVRTTCASRMLENFVPPYDATVMKFIKDAELPVMGKLNMDEFAMGSSTETSYFKKTRNPHDPERVPGGSSGGSAAAVAAHEAVFTLGSDTGGSIRQPAAYCGVVGLKPTYGLVSRFGLIAFASSLDQIGPLTKDVRDAALALDLIAAHDPKDATSVPGARPAYADALTGEIAGMTLGVPEEYLGRGVSEDVRAAVERALKTYESLGAKVEFFRMKTAEYALSAYYIIACAEAGSNLARYDGIKYGYRTPEPPKDITELVMRTRSEGFGKEVRRRIMLGTYVLSAGYYDAYYKKALQFRTAVREEFNRAFDKYDLIVTPTTPNTAFRFGEKSSDPLEMYMEDICTVGVNIAGLPAISLPCGFDRNGMPVGLQLIGPAFGEATLLRGAHAFEQNTDFGKTPAGI